MLGRRELQRIQRRAFIIRQLLEPTGNALNAAILDLLDDITSAVSALETMGSGSTNGHPG
jgi:hypothetical protein